MAEDGAAPGVARYLVSFDIDGTLEVGDPPGPISLDVVRSVQRSGHLIGSSSDRTLGEQRSMWQRNEIEPDFVGHKHRLETLRSFACARFIHIGDTLTDLQFAAAAGFHFWYADDLPLSDPEGAILGGIGGLIPGVPTGPLLP